jgi:hypothetical protein
LANQFINLEIEIVKDLAQRWIDPEVGLESVSGAMDEQILSEMKSRGW